MSVYNLELRRVAESGATAFRLTVQWNSVAPAQPSASFRAADPSDSQYQWAPVDAAIEAFVAHRLVPIVSIIDAPQWAMEPGTTIPAPAQLAAFAKAAARRYDGRFHGLPRVRYWQVWLEPNLTPLLSPQLVNGQPVAAVRYRAMINAFAAVVHAAAPGNLVIAGGTAPFRDITPEVLAQNKDWGPLSFTRAVLCMSPQNKPMCDSRLHFDIWAHHPYTSGGPTHHALYPDDISLGDLGKLTSLLDAARAAGHIVSKQPLQFWVTEFSWDTNPPDPGGVPTLLAARWVSQALYVMWKDGVSLVTWLQLRDVPRSVGYLQAGLYYDGETVRSDRPKPLLQAFRFPVVAFPRGKEIYVWGRTAAGVPGKVVVQRLVNRGWKTLGHVQTDRYGIFQATFTAPTRGSVRAL
jgi:hypothetical protein